MNDIDYRRTGDDMPAMLASADEDGTVRLWDINKYNPIGKPLVGHGRLSASVVGTDRPVVVVQDRGRRRVGAAFSPMECRDVDRLWVAGAKVIRADDRGALSLFDGVVVVTVGRVKFAPGMTDRRSAGRLS